MSFKEFKIKLQDNIGNTIKNQSHLFIVDIDKDEFWNLYLDSFPEGTNPIFRERREYDCSCCRQFIKNFGNVVTLQDGELTTIWDFNINDSTFQPVITALNSYIKSKPISNVFVTKDRVFGTDRNFEQVPEKEVITWEHFYYKLPDKFVTVLRYGETLPTIQSHFRGNKDVFKRSLDELSQESVSTVLELIAQKSLYKGEEWEAVLKQFQKIQKQYMKLEDLKKDLFCWEQSVKVGPVISKIRNHSIGTLLIDITEGMELDEAVKRYEAIVAPSNYKRPKAIFTKKMLEDAQKQLEELGFMNSLGRRFAVIDDITINNIIYANKTSINKIQNNIFEELSNEVAVNPKNFNKVEEIAIEDFITKVIPTTQNIEVFMENKFKGNLVSLIAPKVKDSKTMFKWNNNFSWAYKGNITDSMKERVKDFGGDVEGVLRFSIQWNTCGDNQDDLDAHCKEPNGYHIYYGSKNNRNTTGKLDVDIRHPKTETQDGVAVENITWSNQNKMLEGTYKFYVHNYAKRGSRSGFTAEIEFDGQIHSFSYNTALRDQERIEVAEVIYSKKEGFKLIEKLPSTTSTQKVWNINTMQFHPVSVMMYSPNYWDEQQGIGHKHYFFMIDDCINDESPNGFFNEYLKEDLMKHKRVFEALGSKTKVEDSDNQLSGIGFSSTKRDSVICKVQGNTNRLLKIKF